MGAACASTSSACEVVGLDEAYLDLTGLVAPRAAMRRLVADDPASDRPGRVGRHRPEQARGQGRLGRREARRLRRPHARGGVRALRGRAARASCPASGRRPSSAWPRIGITTLGELARRPRRPSARALRRRTTAATCSPARASTATRAAHARARAVSESRETTFDADIADRAEQEAVLRRLADELCAGLRARAPRAHDRDQGAPRRLDHGHARAHDRGARPPTRHVVGGVALDLLRAYAPAAARAAARRPRRRRSTRRRPRSTPASSRCRCRLPSMPSRHRRRPRALLRARRIRRAAAADHGHERHPPPLGRAVPRRAAARLRGRRLRPPRHGALVGDRAGLHDRRPGRRRRGRARRGRLGHRHVSASRWAG